MVREGLIILPYSGYKNLIIYKKSVVICQGTVVFRHSFLPAHTVRTEARGEA